MKQFVLGDPHGAYKAVLQCFERSGFDKDKDELVVLGDVCDGWPEVKECFDLLLECKHMVYILGNHDKWALEWYTDGYLDGGLPDIWWTSQGGQNTIRSYGGIKGMMDKSHIGLLQGAHVLLEESRSGRKQIFCHGGIDPNKSTDDQEPNSVIWDRVLIENARFKHNQKPDYKYGSFDDIFVGHTTTLVYRTDEPIHSCNVWMLDTGGGWGGKVTIMDTDTKEYWQSDYPKDLYPDEEGR